MSPYLPFTDSEGHKKYVSDKFGEHIFNSHDLASAVKRSIERSILDIDGIENELAVALREEILGRSLAPDEIPIAENDFKSAVNQLVAASQWDVAKSTGKLVVSEVVSCVATRVLIELGVSAGILGAGAANSWWSLGVSLVIGFIVDFIWEWVDDPAGDVEKKVVEALNDLSRNGRLAIQNELVQVLNTRRALWAKTVKEVLP